MGHTDDHAADGRLKVLHLITDLEVGGAESMLTSLLTRAPAADIDARVVSLTPGGAHRANLDAAGIQVADLGMRAGRPRIGAIAALRREIRQFRPRVIQSWMYHADLLAAVTHATLGRAHRPALVWGVRCSDMDTGHYGRRLGLVIGACARLSRRPDAVVANAAAGRAVHRRLGYRARRFEVIPNGIDTARFRPDPAARAAVRAELGLSAETPVLAHLARVDPMKDHDTYMGALARLDGVVGLAIGDGTTELAAAPNLRRLGLRRDTPRLLAAADLIVSSSAFGEGFSNAIAEGMAAGLPAVATAVGDAAAIVGETGRIVPVQDPAALAAAVRALLDEPPAARRERATAARQRIETEFPLARAAERFAALYRELV